VQVRRTLGETAAEMGVLDPLAVADVHAESWPIVRDRDELHDALLTLGVAPAVEEWRAWYKELAEMRRATALGFPDSKVAFWVAAEKLNTAAAVYPGCVFDPPI